jgi:hypothetical protein
VEAQWVFLNVDLLREAHHNIQLCAPLLVFMIFALIPPASLTKCKPDELELKLFSLGAEGNLWGEGSLCMGMAGSGNSIRNLWFFFQHAESFHFAASHVKFFSKVQAQRLSGKSFLREPRFSLIELAERRQTKDSNESSGNVNGETVKGDGERCLMTGSRSELESPNKEEETLKAREKNRVKSVCHDQLNSRGLERKAKAPLLIHVC